MEQKEICPEVFTITGDRIAMCRYGENQAQTPAALYSTGINDPLGLDKFILVAGAPLSNNNYCDIDRLLQTMTHVAATFDLNRDCVPQIAIGVKHGNACGVGVDYENMYIALEKMIEGDDQSLFGGLVMTNFAIDVDEAELILTHATEKRRLLDGIIAPKFSLEAINILKRKGDKCRFVANSALSNLSIASLDVTPIYRYVRGGFLLQPNYTYIFDLMDVELKKYGKITIQEENDMLLAKSICDTSNSNTITLVKENQLIGNGVGQQSRVNGAELAIGLAIKNNHDTNGAVAASDSFFPQPDGPQVLIDEGIRAILSTSKSVKDPEVIKLCQDNNVPIFMIPDEIGRGFFNH